MTAAVTHCMGEHTVPLQNIFVFEGKFIIVNPKGHERSSIVSFNLFPTCPLCFPLGSLTQPLFPTWGPKVIKGTERLHRVSRMNETHYFVLFPFTCLIAVGCWSR